MLNDIVYFAKASTGSLPVKKLWVHCRPLGGPQLLPDKLLSQASFI